MSSYVPSQCLEWPDLIDVTAKCQVITAVIVHLHSAVSLWMQPLLCAIYVYFQKKIQWVLFVHACVMGIFH